MSISITKEFHNGLSLKINLTMEVIVKMFNLIILTQKGYTNGA